MLMASFRPQTFASFFSDRFASDAARSSSGHGIDAMSHLQRVRRGCGGSRPAEA